MLNHILSAFRTYMHGDGAVLLPEMQLLLFAIGTLAMDSWAANTSSEKTSTNPVLQQKYWNPALALAGIAFSALTLWMLRARIMQSGELAGFHLTLVVDSYFVFFSGLLLAATALIILLSVNCGDTISPVRQGRYYALLLFACMSMMLMVSAVDLLVIFLAMEAVAISAYFLAATPGVSNRTPSAAVRFLLSSALGSALVAFAFSLLYGLSGATNISQVAGGLARRHNIAKVIALSRLSGSHGLQMLQLLQSRLPEGVHWHAFTLEALPIAAFVLVSAGMILKFAVPPFQAEFNRADGEADPGIPSPVILYLSGAYAIAAVALLLRSLFTIFADSQNIWWYIIAGLAIAGISYGILASLRQTNLERIVVYLSIAHMGYVLLGVVAANEAAATAMTYYLFTYLFIVTGMFGVLIAVRGNNTFAIALNDLGGLRRRSPVTALLLIIFVLSLAGAPPTAGFFGRYFIFRSLLETGHRYIAWFVALSSLPLAYSYLRIAVYAWRGNKFESECRAIAFGIPEAIVLGICVFVSLAAGLYSEPFTRMARYAFGQ
ncbi:MAG TPA: NADH-quinone oxidoreductase subunit N [Candidatus Eremiobacteraceae bacterium]|nr:NADH-quinone oxidoreductase subunit N [Candidatus Eremiobacteraceae bacterium]